MPTPTTEPTVTSLVDSGIPSKFAIKSVNVAPNKIMTVNWIVMSDAGIIPVPIVFITAPPPMAAPKKMPSALMNKASRRHFTAPEPYAIPIEAAAPLAPIFIAKKSAITKANKVNIVDHELSFIMYADHIPFFRIVPNALTVHH